MPHYALDQRCWPTGDLRVEGIATLLSLIRAPCGISAFELAGGRAFTATPEAIQGVLRPLLAKTSVPGAGADVDIFGRLGDSDDYVSFEIHTGTHAGEPFIDHYNIDFGADGLLVGIDDFKAAVRAMRPFEAFLAELNNDDDLDGYGRQQQVGFFAAPAIIRGLHYFDRQLAAPIGGLEHCLKAPASRAEPFLDGVLIQLVDERFDPTNPAHRRQQQDVMKHLGMAASPALVGPGKPGPLTP
jgi:hypothetical protein